MHLSKTVVIFLFVIFVYLLNVETSYANFVEDYCWRDYNGVIPSDAFKAGLDKKGKPIYIGQTLFDNKLVPGEIQEIHIEFHEEFTINNTIKILCTQYPEKFEWFKTRYDEVLDIKDKHVFEGGYENNVTTYIGRTLSLGETSVGKVKCWIEHQCLPLITAANELYYQHENFEILIYNPQVTEQITDTTTIVSTTGDSSNATVPSNKQSIKQTSSSFLLYFMLVILSAALIVMAIVVARRC